MSRLRNWLPMVAALAAMLIPRAGGQQTDQRPQLPQALAAEVAQDEKVVDAALSSLDSLDQIRKAVPLAQRILEIRRSNQGQAWWETINAQLDLATLRLLESISPAQRAALAQAEQTGGQADDLEKAEKFDQAAEAIRSAAETERKILGDTNPLYAKRLQALARVYFYQGHYAQAEPLLKQVLDIDEKAVGPDHPYVATALNDLAELYSTEAHYQEAEPLFERSLAIDEKDLGPENLKVAQGLNNLAGLSYREEKYPQAEQRFKQALEIEKKVLAPDDPDLATAMNNLGGLYYQEGKYAQAEPLYTRALAIDEKVLGPEHVNVATDLNNLAMLSIQEGKYAQAEPLYTRALAIDERALGQDHPGVATDLDNLALLYQDQGQYTKAEPLYKRALEIREKALGPDHPDVATSVNNLAGLYEAEGQFAQAESLCQRALAIREKALGTDSDAVATSLNDLALLYKEQDHYKQAEPLYNRALAIEKQALGPEHPAVATTLNNIAELEEAQGQYAQAEPLYHQALAIDEKALGPEHPDVATTLDDIAQIFYRQGQYAQAEPLVKRALSIDEKALGPDHPYVATDRNLMGLLLAVTNHAAEATNMLLSSAQIRWQNLAGNFPTMTDQQKREFLSNSNFKQTEELTSLVFQGEGGEPKDGLRGVLLSKQLLFEAARQESGAMEEAIASATPQWRAMWQERETLRHQFATLALEKKPDNGEQRELVGDTVNPAYVRSLSDQIDRLEAQLRQENPSYAQQARLREVTLEDVSRALRPGEALVEYTHFTLYDFSTKKWNSTHYGAYVLRGGSGTVAAIDLGDAASVDAAVKMFQAKIYSFIEDSSGVTPSRSQIRRSEDDVDEASAAIRIRVWQPLEAHLTGSQRIYLAPDGLLDLIPFEALANKDKAGDWHYLVEDHELIYMDTSRDLGRLALSSHAVTNEPKTAVLIGNPAFDAKPEQVAAVVAGLESAARTQLAAAKTSSASGATLGSIAGGGTLRLDVPRPFPQVPVLEQLIDDASKQLKRLGWSVTDLTGDKAVEEAAENVHAPRILQFATHGFVMDRPPDPQSWDNPLLRSMLILAGADDAHLGSTVYYRAGTALLTEAQAKQRGLTDTQLQAARVAPGDGLLTAYEVTGMDLQGTELVNLTACETGLGEVTPDGVAGLRQAFLLAGARSLTVSMWEVPADETTAQVSDFYDRWLGGTKHVARYEAFHAAQLAALARARQDHGSGHPFYWAGIVYVGDPGDLPASTAAAQTGGGSAHE